MTQRSFALVAVMLLIPVAAGAQQPAPAALPPTDSASLVRRNLPAATTASRLGASMPADATAVNGTTSFGPAGSVLLDSPIDRRQYRLGPGDALTVSIFGELSRTYPIVIGPEGTLLIPSVGVVDVLNTNLEQAEQRVRAAMARYYRNVTVRLTLTQVRSFKVFAVGAVDHPGVRTASSVSRVSEVVAPVTEDSVIRRNVLVRHASGDSVRVDLARFLLLGDLASNPTLREGDVIAVGPADRTIRVVGAVAFPGTYEFRPGENLADMLRLANGGDGFPADAADTLRLTRDPDGRHPQVKVLSTAEARGESGRGIVLQPFDAIYVPRIGDFQRQLVARIEGQVFHPGTYPITPGVTRVKDLVGAAGGFLPDASLTAAVLRRGDGPIGDEAMRQLKSAPTDALSRDELQILQIRTAGDSSNVVLSFADLFRSGSQAPDPLLRPGDVLTVPRQRHDVVVLGAVGQPGLVPFTPGLRVDDFVRLAGGYSSRADKHGTTILMAKLGNRVAANDVPIIEPGDQIVVPFKRRNSFTDRVQTAQGLVGIVSALVVTIYGLTRFW